MILRLSVQLLLLGSILLSSSGQVMFYVSPAGNDTNSGSITLPWRTFQKACNSATPGSTVFLRDGVYNEKVTMNVSGTAVEGSIAFEPYPGESAVIDGTGKVGDQLILIENKRYVIIRGLELRNNLDQSFGTGIWLQGYGDHIELRNLTIHDMRAATGGGDAMALSVYGTHPSIPISNVIIDGNLIFDCEPGHSEAVALNGNVDSFAVTNNLLHDVNNIGVVMIGGEETCPNATLDAARNGVCSGNTVYHARSGYGGGFAAGIYVDGGRNIIVERNRVFECDLGIEIGCENKGCTASGMIVRNNLLYDNDKAGLGFGGYNYPQTGRVTTSWFINNTCFRNDRLMTEFGELWIQYAVACTVRNSIFSAGAQNRLLTTTVGNALGNSIDHNLWFSPSGPEGASVDFDGTVYASFAAYQSGTGQDGHSTYANPEFVSVAFPNPDLHLAVTSPARNAGDSLLYSQSGIIDFNGNPRYQNGRIDIGAIEQIVTVPGPPSAPALLAADGHSGQASLRWTRSPEADVERYVMYVDTVTPPGIRRDSTNSSGDTSWTLTNLENEQTYYVQVSAVDMDGNESPRSNELPCLPTVFEDLPSPPILVRADRTADSLQMLLVWRSSPDANRYACEVGTDAPLTSVVWTDSTLVDTNATIVVPARGVYYWRVRGINTLGRGSWSATWSFASGPALYSCGIQNNWNLLSAPIDTPDRASSSMFPSAISGAYIQLSGGYVQADSLPRGMGFWMKFRGTQEAGFGGFPVVAETIHVVPGWNLIGSISTPVAVSGIVSDPPSLETSRFYRYDGNYASVDTLSPFRGHWVKVESEADIFLVPDAPAPSYGQIVVGLADAVPPPPPGESGNGETPLLHPVRFGLEQNFPNPFNPSTTIRFRLPHPGHVLLRVYDSLGRLVATLVNGEVEAGVGSAVWDASALPSGVYICQLAIGGITREQPMMLLK